MNCIRCDSDMVEMEYMGSENTGDGLYCYEKFTCYNCRLSWDEKIDCPDDMDESGKGDEWGTAEDEIRFLDASIIPPIDSPYNS